MAVLGLVVIPAGCAAPSQATLNDGDAGGSAPDDGVGSPTPDDAAGGGSQSSAGSSGVSGSGGTSTTLGAAGTSAAPGSGGTVSGAGGATAGAGGSNADACSNDSQCAPGVCDREFGACVECTLDSHCAAQQDCSDGICRPQLNEPLCMTDADCRAIDLSRGICSRVDNACVECTGDLHCAANEVCVEQVCAYTSSCGNGILDAGETCDAGTNNANDGACLPSCRRNVCGDGQQGPGEGCDDGNTVDGDGCTACRSDGCGDAVVQAGEECDDGNEIATDACSNACTAARCGDGLLQDGEECDEGALNAPSGGCTPDCTSARCGDGYHYTGQDSTETCDDGNHVNDDECSDSCARPRCGDGVVQEGETCDDGNALEDDLCTNMCTSPICGDGVVQDGEECDDGNAVDDDGCSNACIEAACGDGVVQDGEECDLGPANDDEGACTSGCREPECGDGIVQSGEECDNGAANANTAVCTTLCTEARCGDGHLQTLNGEECDDGALISGDGCEDDCTVTTLPFDTQYVLSGDDPTGGLGGALDIYGNLLVSTVNTGSGRIVVYRFDGQRYVEETVITVPSNPGGGNGANSTSPLSVHGEVIAVGTPGYSGEDGSFFQGGAVRVYRFDGANWQLDPLITFDQFDVCEGGGFGEYQCYPQAGYALDLFGDRLIIGLPSADLEDDHGGLPWTLNAGRVIIMRYEQGAWVEEARLQSPSPVGDSEPSVNVRFGQAVALYGDRALVREPDATYVYVRNGVEWSLEATLEPCGASSGWNSVNAGAIALGEDIAVIGHKYTGEAGRETGSAIVYRRNGSSWHEEARLVAPDATRIAWFGDSLAVSDNQVLVGAEQTDGWRGKAYLFERTTTSYPSWRGKLLATGVPLSANIQQSPGLMGAAVALWGNVAAVGQPRYTGVNYQDREGTIHVFQRCDGALCAPHQCEPDSATCDGLLATTCAVDGTFAATGTECEASNTCVLGVCNPWVCTPGMSECVGNAPRRCNDDGLGWYELDACTASEFCEVGVPGCSEPRCRTHVCETPGELGCSQEEAGLCLPDGSGVQSGIDCRDSGQACVAGACVAPLFYAGFETGGVAGWTVWGGSPTTVQTDGAAGTTRSLVVAPSPDVSGWIERSFSNFTPLSIGVWVKGEEASIFINGSGATSARFGATLALGRIALTSGQSIEPTVVRHDAWHLIEFRNIDWSSGTFDFYIDEQLIAAQAAMTGNASSLDSIALRGFRDALHDELMVK